MASYTKTVNIIDSGNSYFGGISSVRIYNNPSSSFIVDARAETLHLTDQMINGRMVTQASPEFLPDYSGITAGKKIVEVKLHFRTKSSYYEKLHSGDGGSIIISSADWYVYTRVPSEYDVYKRDPINLYQYREYMGSGNADYGMGRWLEIYSHISGYKPYAVITYEDTPPNIPGKQFPSNINVDARTPIKFSWEYSSKDSQVQSRYEIQYSTNEQSTWTTVSGDNGNKYHDFAASKFPTTGIVHWKVRVRDSNNLWSDWSSVYKFNTVVTPQKTPRIISPTSGYLDGSEKIKLSWEFLGGADYDNQGKYELQYSTDGSNWNTITKTTALQEHEFDKDFFGSGRVEWKVKTFNTFNDESDYTEVATFNVISSPPIPQIQIITNSSRPKITWISIEQQYYKIKIYDESDKLIYEHKEPSINKFHDVKIFMDDGNYRAELVIFNQYNLNSETATMDFAISTVKPPQPIIDVYSSEYSNTIKGSSNTQHTRVYRDGIFIGLLENNIFIDFTCENRKEYKYHLRAIDDEGNFNDSDTKIGICNFRNNTISTAKSPGDFIKLKYGLSSIPSKNTRKSVLGSNFYFDGREYPVVEFSEFKSTEKTLKFFTRYKSDIDKLEELINKKEVLLYRDVEGEKIYGTILSIDYDKEMLGYNFGFTINKTDYSGDLDD